MARVLTENQEKFLSVLFEEANGDPFVAKKLAGYSDTTSTSVITNALKEEILEATHKYMARLAPKAAVAFGSALVDPTELGIRDKLSAAREVLDRIGIVKTEKMQVQASGGVILLPPKDPVIEDDD
jgi:hypothetical protein